MTSRRYGGAIFYRKTVQFPQKGSFATQGMAMIMTKRHDSGLTEIQQIILEFTRGFIAENDYPPTVREICAGTSIRSTSTVHSNLRLLSERGLVKYTPSTRRSLSVVDDEADEVRTVPLPLVGDVAAGLPMLAIENVQEYYSLPASIMRGAHENEAFMLTIKGSSMIDIGMYEGDMIVVNSTLAVNNGDIAVVRVGGESATVKRWYKERDRVRLQPENSEMAPIYVALNDVEVVGKVVALIREF